MAEKTALISGCSSGIGRASALAFRSEEWRVYATARDPATLDALDDAGCHTAELDVTDGEGVERVVDRVMEEAGRIDCLVNDPGYAQHGPIEDVPADRVHAQFDANVYGVHRLTRAVLPHMRDRGEGVVVNLSSAVGRVATPGLGVYSASKFAVEAMSDALRPEVADYGIDVVVVEPGPVDTRFAERAASEVSVLDRSGAYDAFYELYEDSEDLGGEGPFVLAPERVAVAVVDAAVSPDPPARYPVGTLARVAGYARLLPDGLRDRLLGFALRRL
jgi:NAD(P)-dependent dehydrogenase (short-subunit alcohol dehydrogenase family)